MTASTRSRGGLGLQLTISRKGSRFDQCRSRTQTGKKLRIQIFKAVRLTRVQSQGASCRSGFGGIARRGLAVGKMGFRNSYKIQTPHFSQTSIDNGHNIKISKGFSPRCGVSALRGQGPSLGRLPTSVERWERGGETENAALIKPTGQLADGPAI